MTWRVLGDEALDCLRRLRAVGKAAYPVGGCVRDLLLGRRPGDVDICTSARPEEVLALFPAAVPTGLRHGTGDVEITTFRREEGYTDGRHPDRVSFDTGLTEDLARRDFTINAMALEEDGTVLDPFGGRKDLERRLIRCVGDPRRRFSEDALRMLRAVRFSAQLGFALEEETAAALKEKAHLTAGLSRERILSEMERTLLSPRPEQIGGMIESGLLDHLYPFPAGFCLSALSVLPTAGEERWRGFCAATGFPIAALPVTRKLRRAVEHPESALISRLALSGGELMAMGLKGAEISAAQKKLARHIVDHPEDNIPEKLKVLIGFF